MSATPDPPGRPRLLVLNQYFGGPEATGRVLEALVDGLALDGDVDVVAADRMASSREERRPSGTRVIRVPTTRLRGRGLTGRGLDYALFLAGCAGRALRAPRPDVVICMTDPPLIGALAATVGALRRARLIVVMQDLHPELGVATGRLTNPAVVAILRAARAIALGRADAVVVIGEAMRRRVIALGVPASRVRVIPNGVDVGAIVPGDRGGAWARAHGLEADRFVAMHAGNIGQLQGLPTLAHAARQAPEVTVAIVGDGSGRARLEAESARGGDVVLFPRQPEAELPAVLAATDVHVVSLEPGLAGLIEPSKLYGVLAAGRPVVAVLDDESEGARLVREAACGVVVAPGDAGALAAALRSLATRPREELATMGARARRLAEQRCGQERTVAAYRRLVAEVLAAGRAS